MNHSNEQRNAISLADVFRNTVRRPKRILASTFLGLVAGLAIVTLIKPSYLTEAKILIERREVPLNPDGSPSQDAALPIDERLISSQIAVLKSDDFAAKLVSKLKLDQDPDFAPEKVTYGVAKSFLVRFGFSDDIRSLPRDRRATDSFSNALTVFTEPNSNVITVRTEAANPAQAARIANSLAEEYIHSTSTDEGTDAKRVQDWLAAQIDELRSKVSTSEAAVEKFRAGAGLLKGTNSTLGVQEISELNTQLTVAEGAQGEAAARAREIKSLLARKGNIDTSAEVLNAPGIQNLQDQRIAANRQLAELSAVYLPKNPKLQAARKQVDEIDRQIRREAIKIIDGLDSQAKIAEERAASIRKNLEKLKERESAANLDDVTLKALERESTANRQLLETLLARYVEVNTRKDFDVRPTLARIIQTAVVPSSVSFPRTGPTVLLTTLGGLGLGLGLSFLAAIMRMSAAAPNGNRRNPEYSTQLEPQSHSYDPPPQPSRFTPPPAAAPSATVNPPAPIVATAPLPVVAHPPTAPVTPVTPIFAPVIDVDPAAIVPDLNSSFQNVPIHAPFAYNGASPPKPLKSAPAIGVGEEDLSLSGNLLALNKASGARNFAFTRVGCAPAELAMAVFNSAREIASAKNRVLVMDLDHERAELERLFRLPEGHGLLDLLAGQSDFSKLIARDPLSGVHIIRLGDVTNARQPQMLAEQILSVLRSIQGIYDFVLLHVGQASSECLPFMLTCDVAVIVAPPTHDLEVVKAIQTLTERGPVQVLHVAVDRTSVTATAA